MIDELQVKNLALIRDATLQPCAGLTVLTGETGAGKSALLSALKLLMGSRASADMVRDGESGLIVSGRFFGLSAEADEDSEVIVTRKVSVEGRSRATVNGVMTSIGEVSAIVSPSIDLCGQFEHQQLMRPAAHVGLLDVWSGENIASKLADYRTALDQANRAAAELARIEGAQHQSEAALDEAQFILSRIDEVHPIEGEYDQLAHDLELAEHAESLVTAAETAHAALAGDAGALDALNVATAALENAADVDASLGELASALREAGYIMEDVSRQVRSYRDKIEFDPAELVKQQDRFAAMQGLLRAYGPRMEDVLARRAAAADLIAIVDDSEEMLRHARAALDKAEIELLKAADELDAARLSAAPRFSAEVAVVMERLQMSGAELVCSLERLPRASWSNAGPSSFEFLYRPAVGMQARPLARIASGGEVSRVMLAIKVVLGVHDDVDTLVFDEVDAGTGGSVAVSLAHEIARLAQTHQVIVVTHLAQVAVQAETHYVVTRDGNETVLSKVVGKEREQEVARMLSGSATEVSLAHARELLQSVR